MCGEGSAKTYFLRFSVYPVFFSKIYLAEVVYETHSLTRRGGRVGTNLSFCVPSLVTSLCFFARLAIAFPEPEPEPEPEGVPLPEGCCDIVQLYAVCVPMDSAICSMEVRAGPSPSPSPSLS